MRRVCIHFHLMASGLSRRFGSNKLFHTWEGRPLYQRALLLYEEVGQLLTEQLLDREDPIEVISILHCIAADSQILDWAQEHTQALPLLNEQNQEGISASIRLGVQAAQAWEIQHQISVDPAPNDSCCQMVLNSSIGSYNQTVLFTKIRDEKKKSRERVGSGSTYKYWEPYDVFCVCDQPRLQVQTLLEYFQFCVLQHISLATPASDAIWGNPCWFSAKYRTELLALQGDQGGKKVIRNHLDTLTLYPVDLSELLDVDTQEDLESMV